MSNSTKQRPAIRSGVLALLLAVAAVSSSASAQDLTVSWNPRSGDVWVDTWLGDVNRYGTQYREPFIDELVRYHAAPRPLVIELLERRRWAPGDVYYACSIASIIGRPCRYVVDMYEADRGQGWGVLAQRLGIKPGSAEFHRLKKGFVPTYDRWARPIDLDDDLRRAYPDRGKGKGGKGPGNGKASTDHGKAGKAAAGKGNGGKKAQGASSGHGAKQTGQGKGGGKSGGPSGKGQGGDKKGGGKGNGKG